MDYIEEITDQLRQLGELPDTNSGELPKKEPEAQTTSTTSEKPVIFTSTESVKEEPTPKKELEVQTTSVATEEPVIFGQIEHEPTNQNELGLKVLCDKSEADEKLERFRQFKVKGQNSEGSKCRYEISAKLEKKLKSQYLLLSKRIVDHVRKYGKPPFVVRNQNFEPKFLCKPPTRKKN